MTEKQKIAQFRQLLDLVFAKRVERIENQVDFNDKYQNLFKQEYEKLRKIVFSAKEAPFLKDLMKTYLDRYWTYRDNKNNVRFSKSDQLYQFLIEQSAKVSDPSLFETWATYLKDTSVLVSFRDRFEALDPYFQREIENFIKRERERRRSIRSLIDVLRDEYSRIHDGTQPSQAELDAFDPRPSFKGLIENRIGTVDSRWHDALEKPTDDNLDRFAKELSNFSDYLKALGNDDLLRLFQAFKQVRDPIYELEVHRRVLYYGLHAIACIQLHSAVLRKKAYQKNLDGLTPDEIEFFVGPVRKTRFLYRSNVIRALTGSLRNPSVAIGQITVFLNTYLTAQARYPGKLSLLNLDETLHVQKKWADLKDMSEQIGLATRRKDLAALTRILSDPRNADALRSVRQMESRKVQVSSGHILGTRILKAGSRIQGHPVLGTIAIASIEKGDVIYVELGPFKPQLFQASHTFLADRQFAEKILEIHASTIGMVQLMEVVFKAMGFLLPFVQGGFVGLFYEIATFYATEWLEKQVAKLSPELAMVLGLALSLFGPRPNFQRKLKTDMVHAPADRTGLSDVFNPASKGIDTGSRKAQGAGIAAAERTETVVDRLGTVRPGAIEPPVITKPPLEPPAPARPTPTQPAKPSAGDNLTLRRMGAEARMRTAKPANEGIGPGTSLPQAAAKNEEAAIRLGTGTQGRTIATPETPAGGTVTYQPSATRPPVRPDTKFAKGQEALQGKLSSNASGGATRGLAASSRATPPQTSSGAKSIELPQRRGDGLKQRMREFIKRAATIYRQEMKLQDKNLPIWERSTNAHKNTLDRLRAEYKDVTEHGQPFTGVTGPGTASRPNVRIADATYVDLNSPARKSTPADLHIELKAKAYPEQNGKVLRVSGEKSPAVTSEQIQAYEAAQTELGVPTFVINMRGHIYALKGERWIKVGGPGVTGQ